MFQVRVGQIWKDKGRDDVCTFLVKKVKEQLNSKSFIVEAYFLAGPYKGITREWYVDSVDTLLADSV